MDNIFHPHRHFLVTEGGVDGAGVFHKIPRSDNSHLAFPYFELNLTPDQAAIYHPGRWGEAKLTPKRSFSQRS